MPELSAQDAQRILTIPKGLFGASLPVNLRWLQWWKANRDRFKHASPGVMFVIDAIPKLFRFYATVGRVMRAKPQYDTAGWSPDELRPLHEVAREGLAWFYKSKPRVEGDTPPWLALIYEMIEGCFLMAVRLADECERSLRTGFVPIRISEHRVTPSMPERGREID
jgi:hypothetical protein